MTSKKNLPASVHARLLNRARSTGRPFQEVFQYYAMERLLYRLSCSPNARSFVLKGALMMRVWDAPYARPTKDLDLLGQGSHVPEQLADIFRQICVEDVEPDGMVFHAETLSVLRIANEGTAPDADKIIDYCREHLAAYKVPRAVQFVDDFPKTSSGKIMRRKLHELDEGQAQHS